MTSSSDTKATVQGVERDNDFYFDDDPMAVFLVEDKLFRVHRHFFIKGSQIFRDMFSSANTNHEGETDEKPIPLPGVTRNEFQTLLKFFYSSPSRVLGTGPMVLPGVIESTLDDKLSLLSISHRFLFDAIFHFILQKVQSSSIPAAERIRLGDKYHIAGWLSSAYTSLLDRSPDDLSAEEAEALGFGRVVCLYKAKCFMYQERVEKAGESSTGRESSGEHSSVEEIPDFWPSKSRKKSKPKEKLETGKKLTPTSEVVKKFFILK